MVLVTLAGVCLEDGRGESDVRVEFVDCEVADDDVDVADEVLVVPEACPAFLGQLVLVREVGGGLRTDLDE